MLNPHFSSPGFFIFTNLRNESEFSDVWNGTQVSLAGSVPAAARCGFWPFFLSEKTWENGRTKRDFQWQKRGPVDMILYKWHR